MGIYDRYILSQLLVLFGFFSLVLISVYLLNQTVELFDSILADGQNLWVFLEFTALSLPQIIMLVLPVSAFVATIYLFNRLIAESELVVLQTAGLSPLRLLRPVIGFAAGLAALVLVLANLLEPAARTALNERSVEVSRDLVSRFLREGEFLQPTDGLTVFIDEITELGEFREIFLRDDSDDRMLVTYTAERALLVNADGGPRLVMFDGLAQTLNRETDRLSVVEFRDFTFDLSALINVNSERRIDYRELSTYELLTADAARAEELRRPLARLRHIGHTRIAQGLYALSIPLIAAATLMLGSFSRLGLWPQILLAVGLMVPTQALFNVGARYATEDVSLAWTVYLQPLVGAIIAVTVIILAGRKRRAVTRMARGVSGDPGSGSPGGQAA